MADNSFYTNTIVTSTSFTSPIDWVFTSYGIVFLVRSSDPIDAIEYSFNGIDVHGDLVPSTPSGSMTFTARAETKVWFRKVNVLAGDIVVLIEAWRS